jgi:hypothetical protein
VHHNTAFALSLLLDGARARGDDRFAARLRERAIGWYHGDRDYPIDWEPSGQDFLSAGLAEADLMRRVLPAEEFPTWLAGFLPRLRLRPVAPLDPGDGQQSHLYGLGLSRAWQLRALAEALPAGDPRVASFRTVAEEETARGVGALTDGSFLTRHWLATFAFLALSDDPGTVAPGTERSARARWVSGNARGHGGTTARQPGG